MLRAGNQKQDLVADWLIDSASQRLQSAQKECCATVVSNVYGHHALQMTLSPACPDFLQASQTMAQHHLVVAADGMTTGSVLTSVFELPFADESLTLAVIANIHELVETPEQVFSGLFAALEPGGLLIVMGMMRSGHLRRSAGKPPWLRRYYSQHQLNRYCQEIGFSRLLFRAVLDPDDWYDRLYRRSQPLLRFLNPTPMDRLISGYLTAFRKPDSIQFIRLKKIKDKTRLSAPATSGVT